MLFQNVSGSGKDMGQAYVNFTRNCMDQIRSKVNDELWILNFFEVNVVLFNMVLCRLREEEKMHSLCISIAAMVYSSDSTAVQLVVGKAGPLTSLVPVHLFGTYCEGKCTVLSTSEMLTLPPAFMLGSRGS